MSYINAIQANFKSILETKGMTPGNGVTAQVIDSLIYVVLPMNQLTLKNRGGANPDEQSIIFEGGYMSTQGKKVGARGTQHLSTPFTLFLSDKARMFAPADGATKATKNSLGKNIWSTNLNKIEWMHTIQGNETTKLPMGTEVPYNFRFSLSRGDLATFGVGPNTDYDTIWERMKKHLPTRKPQLHLVLSISTDTMVKAKAQMVHGTQNWSMYVELKGADVLAVEWQLPTVEVNGEVVDNPLYDKTASLVTDIVSHRANFKVVQAAAEGPRVVDVREVTLAKPEKTMRDLVIRKVNAAGANSPDILKGILDGLEGQLAVWWGKLPSDTKAKLMAEYGGITPKGSKAINAKAMPGVTPPPVAPTPVEKEHKVAASSPAVPFDVDASLDFDFSELDALLDMPIEAPAPKPQPKPKAVVAPKIGGNIGSTLASDDAWDDLDTI